MNRLLQFENLHNVRELGGFVAGGGITRRGRYIRGTAEGTLTEAEKEFLYRSGIRAVVDLRYAGEIARTPSPLAGWRDIQYRNIDLLGDFIPHLGSGGDRDLGDFYRAWLENSRGRIAEVFHTFAEFAGEGVFFHCAVGKDRTGLVAALLLGLCGCRREDIVADYAQSCANNHAIYAGMEVPEGQEHFLYSEPVYIEKALRYLEDAGGVPAYLSAIGVTAETQRFLRDRFLSPIVIRPETPADFEGTLQLVSTAFQTARVSGGEETALIERVRKSENYLPELSLIAECDGEPVGYLMLSRTAVERERESFPALLLGPVCTLEACRNRRIGERLICRALADAEAAGHAAVFLAGDRDYYRRFGFQPASRHDIRCQYELPVELLDNIMALELRPEALKGISGTVAL